MDTCAVTTTVSAGLLKLCCSFTIIALSLVGLSHSHELRAQIQISACGVNPHEVDDVFFLDSTHGWIVVEDHRLDLSDLFRTTDGGKSWTRVQAPSGVGEICFVTPNLGWAIRGIKSGERYFGYLLRTSDSGSTWNQTMTQPLDAGLAPDEFVVHMAFSDGKLGWFFSSGTGPAGSVLVTRDGGKTVQVLSTPSDDRDYRGIFALPGERVWVLGSNNILSTHDIGETWEQQFNWVEPHPNSAQTMLSSGSFFPDGLGWVVGQNVDKGIVLATHDFGRHWNQVYESAESQNLYSVYFSDERNGCAIGFDESIFCTNDGGTTWTDRKVLPSPRREQANFFVQIVMLNSGRGFALRAGGFLYETIDGGQTWHEFDPLTGVDKR